MILNVCFYFLCLLERLFHKMANVLLRYPCHADDKTLFVPFAFRLTASSTGQKRYRHWDRRSLASSGTESHKVCIYGCLLSWPYRWRSLQRWTNDVIDSIRYPQEGNERGRHVCGFLVLIQCTDHQDLHAMISSSITMQHNNRIYSFIDSFLVHRSHLQTTASKTFFLYSWFTRLVRNEEDTESEIWLLSK